MAVPSETLSYVEVHLTDHCNLNCKGCGHYAPLADTWFTNLREFERDMKQLRILFAGIDVIRLMGGEPLLHPKVVGFLAATRDCFPTANVHLVTNGILLPQMPEQFWAACRSYRVALDITLYPPLMDQALSTVASVRVKGIRAYPGEVKKFMARMDVAGRSDAAEAFAACRTHLYCPFLQRGRIYVCCMSAMIHLFNRRFRTAIPTDAGIDLHAPSLSGREIKGRLNEPSATCRYCVSQPVEFDWAVSQQLITDWDATACCILPDSQAPSSHFSRESGKE